MKPPTKKPKGPDFSGPFSQPMRDDPTLLLLVTHQKEYGLFAKEHETGLCEPEDNAVVGRCRDQIRCRDCGMIFQSDAALIHHVANEGHVGISISAREIVPVKASDPWQWWEDGAGVSWDDRNPAND